MVVLLVSSSDISFSSGVTFVDTNLQKPSGDEVFVTTKMDFGNQENRATFPMEVGQWAGFEYDAAESKEQLGADIIVLRGYMPQMFFLIMQSETALNFHSPNVFYRVQAYTFEEGKKENVVVKGADWICDSKMLSHSPLLCSLVF